MDHPRLATSADRRRVAATVAAAFAADPAFRYFFPEPATFTHEATAFAEHLFDKRVTGSTIWVIEDGSSVAMWDGPGAVGHGTPPPGLPAATVERLERWDAMVSAALPTEPHWYLGVLATDPSRAGRRWGRAVMAPGLDRAAEDGLPAYLETATSVNVELYRRAGWEVVRTVDNLPFPVWILARPPA